MLRVHFLGQPRFYAGDVPHPFRGRPRTIALLAFLLLHRDAHLPRDMIAFSLWPDDGEEEARGKLRRHLHDLTSVLPASDVPYVLSAGDTLAWNPSAALRFDVDAFEDGCGDLETAVGAVDLYDGDLLPTVFDDWIFPIRDRLRRTYLATLERLVVRSRSRRRFDTGLAFAERILAHDAWREDVVRHLVSILYESGNRAGALRELDAFAERLRADLGVDPMPETQTLRGIVLRGGTLPDDDAPNVESDAGNGFPFVGRTREVETLLATWRRAARGRGEVVLIGGDAGIGKTRLCSELALIVGSQGGRVLRGSTASPERTPYQALVEAVRDAVPLVADLSIKPIWLAAVATLVPELLAERNDLPAALPLDDRRESARLREALAALLAALGRKRPLLLVLEDVHWAGVATLEALAHLARSVAGMPAMIVATYRTGDPDAGREVSALRRRLQLENVATHLALGGLPPEAVCDLARAVPAFADESDAVGAGIHRETDGNPLFACELLRERAESGATEGSPRGLRETLARRSARLSERAQTVAEVASVVGTTFDIEIVRDVVGWPENEVFDALAELLDRRLVREVGRSGFAFVFAHEVIAALSYDAVAAARKKRLHASVARALERVAGDGSPATSAAALARHYECGGDPARAATKYATVAAHAFGVYANADALRACERGLDVCADDATRYVLVALHEAVCARLGHRDLQAIDLDVLDRLVSSQPDPDVAHGDVLWRRALLAHVLSRLSDEARILEDVGARAEASGDARRRTDVLLAQARNAIVTGRYADGAAACERALAYTRDRDDVAGEVESLCLAAEAAVNHGDAARVTSALAAARERAEASGDRALATRVHMAVAAAAINVRDFVTAVEHARAALAGYREFGDREGEAEACARVAGALAFSGKLDEGRALFGVAAGIYRTLGNRLKLAFLLFNRCGAEIQVGLLDEAEASARSALAIFEEFDDRRGLASARTNLSMIRLLMGATEEARTLALAGLADARAIENLLIEAAALSNLGNAERELGFTADALDHMRDAIAIRTRLDRPATFEELADLALAHLRANDGEAALVVAADIEALARTSNDNLQWPHYCFFAAARVRHATGDARRAAENLRRASAHVREQRDALVDPASRAAFDSLATIRDIARAESGVWPEDDRPADVVRQSTDSGSIASSLRATRDPSAHA